LRFVGVESGARQKKRQERKGLTTRPVAENTAITERERP